MSNTGKGRGRFLGVVSATTASPAVAGGIRTGRERWWSYARMAHLAVSVHVVEAAWVVRGESRHASQHETSQVRRCTRSLGRISPRARSR